MTKIKENIDKFNWVYGVGFFIILTLPILIYQPYFFPADWGKSVVFRGVLAIMIFLFLGEIINKAIELPFARINKIKTVWALRALLAIFFLASIFSVDPFFSFWGSPYRGGGFITFAFFLIFVILSFILLKKEHWNKVWIFSIFIGVLVSLLGIIQYYGLVNNFFMAFPDRPPSTMGNPNLLATYLLLLSFITLSFSIKEPFNTIQDKVRKIFYASALGIFIFTILITGSRSAYLGILIGLAYFIISFPKKIKALKIICISLLVVVAGIIIYANAINQYPKFLQDNKIFSSISSRLSTQLLLTDPRFYAWTKIDYKLLIDRPILGYGPENFAVGFDKYYDPSVSYLNIAWGDWYDKAHNIILQTGSDAGILGIIAYLELFIVLFWELQKVKNNKQSLVAHGIQATLIGYFVTNLFGFDAFGTYIIFFLLIAYSLNLIYENHNSESTLIESRDIRDKAPWKSATIFVTFCLLVIFLWQYNLVPLQINAEINKASILVDQKKCDQAFALMDKILPQHSFLDSYKIMEYVEFERTCAASHPENNLAYTKKGIELLSEAVKIQPLYTRYWLFLGNLTTTLAEQQNDLASKNKMLLQADGYLDRALQLGPKHQEIIIAKAKVQIDEKNYIGAQNYSKQCLSLYSGLGDCYWYLGLSEIYLKNSKANKDIQTAITQGFNANSETSLIELANAYNSVSDYQNLATVFEKLIITSPNNVQNHSTLAFIYAKLGEYAKARQQAAVVLQLSPASKQNVDAFLSTLP